jgi:hypothetical protein
MPQTAQTCCCVDFQAFGPLKEVLKGHKFWWDEDVKTTVIQWFQQQPKEFFAEGIHQLVQKWDTCPNNHSDCF